MQGALGVLTSTAVDSRVAFDVEVGEMRASHHHP